MVVDLRKEIARLPETLFGVPFDPHPVFAQVTFQRHCRGF